MSTTSLRVAIKHIKLQQQRLEQREALDYVNPLVCCADLCRRSTIGEQISDEIRFGCEALLSAANLGLVLLKYDNDIEHVPAPLRTDVANKLVPVIDHHRQACCRTMSWVVLSAAADLAAHEQARRTGRVAGAPPQYAAPRAAGVRARVRQVTSQQ